MTASAVPATIDALVALFAAALPGGAVYDGPGVTDADLDLWVLVGCDDNNGEGPASAAAGQQKWPGLGPHRARDEDFTVRCVMSARRGDGNQKAARDNAFASLEALTTAIQTDPSLGGVVLYSRGIDDFELRQTQDEYGATAEIAFTVGCRARIS